MRHFIVALALFITGSIFAQSKQHFTPEQKTKLLVKKLAVELDLSTSQQGKLYPILLEESQKREAKHQERKAKREAGEKPSSDEMYTRAMHRLNEKEAFYNKVKSVLKRDQFDDFKRMSRAHHQEKRKHHKEKMHKAKKGKSCKGKKNCDPKKQA